MIRFKQFIAEALPFKKQGDRLYSFEVDGQEMEVDFRDDRGEITFGFPHRGISKFEATGSNKNQFKIINTVTDIISQHTKNMPSGTKYMFVANGKKATLYQRLLKKFQAEKDWNIDIKDRGYGISVGLTKK